MKKLLVACTCILVLIQLHCCIPLKKSKLKVELYPQATDVWCWAASAQMVMGYLGKDVPQCQQAGDVVNQFNTGQMVDCCAPVVPEACLIRGWPQFDMYGFDYKQTSNVGLPWPVLVKQLAKTPFCVPKPICYSYHHAGGGHMVVIIGYKFTENVRYVLVNDPWPPDGGSFYVLTYEQYLGDVYHPHWNDYYDIKLSEVNNE